MGVKRTNVWNIQGDEAQSNLEFVEEAELVGLKPLMVSNGE